MKAVTLITPRWMEILRSITPETKNIRQLDSVVYGTYANTYQYIAVLQEKKIIKLHKDGRSQVPKLTKKGEKLQELLFQVQPLIK
jgi:predicted transcriptional regulator